jgi:hypothetical protein
MKDCTFVNFRKLYLTLALMGAARLITLGQGWVLSVEVDINHSDCSLEKLTSATVSFAGVTGTGSSNNSKTTITLKGTGSTQNQTLQVQANASCTQSYDPSRPVANFSKTFSQSRSFTDCALSSYSSFVAGDKVDVDGAIQFYPRMVIGTPAFSCGQVTIAALNCTSSNLVWEVSNDPLNGPWYVISGKTTASITVTADDLHRNEFGIYKYLQRWVRVTNVSGTTSEPLEVTVPAPPPTITSLIATPPLCPDSTGTIQITHGSGTPQGVEFVYTVTQYVRRREGSCLAGYGTGNSLTQQDIDQIQRLCGGATTINIGSEVFCSGFIGNYRKTFVGSDFSYTLSKNSIQQTSGSGGFLKLYPGIYIVEIEKKNGQDAYDCVCRYVVEVPPANAILNIPSSGISVTSPRCKGGNDGAAALSIAIRAMYSPTFDINYTLFKNQSGTFTVYKSLSDVKVNLNAGTLSLPGLETGTYLLKVWDYCVNYPVTATFTVGDASPLSLVRFTEDPDCLNDSNSDGIAEAGDGAIVGVAGMIAGLTYDFKLYSSGGTLLKSHLNSGANTYTFSNLPNNGYYYTVRTSNNCKSDSSISILEVPQPLSVSAATKDASCSNTTDGRIKLINIAKTSGTIRYAYQVSASDNSLVTQGTDITAAPEFLVPYNFPPGAYSISIRDQCAVAPNIITVSNLSVNRPRELMIQQQSDISLTCFNGQIETPVSIRFAYGTTPYTVEVMKENQNLAGFPKTNVTSTVQQLAALSRGSYTVKIRDACAVESSMVFQVRSNATSDLHTDITELLYDNNGDGALDSKDYNLTCLQRNDGRIQVQVAGGVQNSSNPKYKIHLLDEFGNPLVDNLNNPGAIVQSLQGAIATYTITNLKASFPYMIRVTDYNTQPGPCSRVFDRTVSNEKLMLTAPLPVSVKNPVSLDDFDSVSFFNGDLYLKCRGDSNAVFHTSVTGGNPPYATGLMYSESSAVPFRVLNSLSSPWGQITFRDLTAGFYKLVVSDFFGCDYTETPFRLRESGESLTIDSVGKFTYAHGANTSCFGAVDGKIFVSAKGGTGNYSFRLDTPTDVIALSKDAMSHTFTGLAADAMKPYSISITDELGCRTADSPLSIGHLQAPEPLQIAYEVASKTAGGYDIPCYGNYATVRLTARGGLAPYRVKIGGVTAVIEMQSGFAEVLLPAGSHHALLMDALGCTIPPIDIHLRSPDSPLSISALDVRSPACIGGTDGQITLSAQGGIPYQTKGYNFEIRPLQNSSDSVRHVSELNIAFTGAAQAYKVIIRDSVGCSYHEDLAVPVNASPLRLQIDTIVAPSCSGRSDGSISVSATNFQLAGGDSLTFLISGGIFGSAVEELSSANATCTIAGLKGTPGVSAYRLWVDDSNHCSDTAFQFLPMIFVTDPEPLVASIVGFQNPACAGSDNGTASITFTGAAPPYYLSLNDSTYSLIDPNHTIRNLVAGKHNFYVRDSKGPGVAPCRTRVTVMLDDGLSVELDPVITHTSCTNGTDGAIRIHPSLKGVAPGEVFDKKNFQIDWLALPGLDSVSDLDNLAAGVYRSIYKYKVGTDVCSRQTDYSILQPESDIHVNSVATFEASCGSAMDGKVLLNFSGGWPDSLNYYRLDGKFPQMFSGYDLLLAGLTAGSHTVVFSQSSACPDTISFNIERATMKLVIASVVPPQCPFGADGFVKLESTHMPAIFHLGDFPSNETGIFQGISKGTYEGYAVLRSDTTCKSTGVSVAVDDPPDCGLGPLKVNLLAAIPSTCKNSATGEAFVQASGGVPPYTFYWNGSSEPAEGSAFNLPVGDHLVVVSDRVNKRDSLFVSIQATPPLTYTSFTVPPTCDGSCDGQIELLTEGGSGSASIMWLDGVEGNSRTGVCEGTYEFKLIDDGDANCYVTGSIITKSLKPLQIAIEELQAPACYGDDNGRARIKVSGGSGKYDVTWDDSSTGVSLESAASGLHRIRVSDRVFSCTYVSTVSIPEPSHVSIDTVLITPPRCHDERNGGAELVLGDSTDALIMWDNGQVGNRLSNVPAGDMKFRITDFRNCLSEGIVTIPSRAPVELYASAQDNSCFNSCNGSVTISASGGIAPYSITWNDLWVGQRMTDRCAGTYDLVADDAVGCRATAQIVIRQPQQLAMTADVSNPACNGKNDGRITVYASGGIAPYEFSWNNSPGFSLLRDLPAGTYNLLLTDSLQCELNKHFTLSEPDPIVFNSEITQPSCFGSRDGFIRNVVSGGSPPFTFEWNGTKGGPHILNIGSGHYDFVISDSHGCFSAGNFFVDQPEKLEFVNVTVDNPRCYNSSDGKISYDVVGGETPYHTDVQGPYNGNDFSALPPGTYVVTVTDHRGCVAYKDLIVDAPDRPVIKGIAPSLEICSGSIAAIAPSGRWKRYWWQGPQGFTSSKSHVEVNTEGKYSLTTWDKNECVADTVFLIQNTPNALHSDFIRVTNAVVYSPVVFLDITSPAPQRVEWNLPKTGAILSNQSNSSLELIFTEAGRYEIGMKAFLDNCVSGIIRSIEVDEPVADTTDFNTEGRVNRNDLELSVFPNPVTNVLHLILHSHSQKPISISLVRSVDNGISRSETLSGSTRYMIDWELSDFTSGIYYIVAEQGGTVVSARVAVVK